MKMKKKSPFWGYITCGVKISYKGKIVVISSYANSAKNATI